MNRRSFFKKAATGAAVLAVAPKILSEPFMPKSAVFGDYYEYANFSSFALKADMEKIVQEAAEQLGYAAGQSMRQLERVTFDTENYKFLGDRV